MDDAAQEMNDQNKSVGCRSIILIASSEGTGLVVCVADMSRVEDIFKVLPNRASLPCSPARHDKDARDEEGGGGGGLKPP